jgi:hypothetical protein
MMIGVDPHKASHTAAATEAESSASSRRSNMTGLAWPLREPTELPLGEAQNRSQRALRPPPSSTAEIDLGPQARVVQG